MFKAKWMAIPVLAAALAVGGAAQGGLITASDNLATAQDFSAKKGGKGKAHAFKKRGAKSVNFCPPGQAKKPGLGSAHRC